jgi:hypothetical protein
LLPQPLDERRRMFLPGHGDRHLLGFTLPLGDAIHHEPDEHRAEDDRESNREQRPPVAQRIGQLLAENDERLPKRARVHRRSRNHRNTEKACPITIALCRCQSEVR